MPFQRITHFESRPLPLMELTRVPETEREARAGQLASAEIKQPFDLTNGPLLRALLLRLSDDDHVLTLTMHRIAADGWSIGVLCAS